MDPRQPLGGAQQHQDSGEPANARLWQIIVIRAKAKFDKYPSPAASAWAHKEYLKMGGKYKQVKHKR